jgi:hypothetical protein
MNTHLCSVKIRNIGKVAFFMSIFSVLNEKSIWRVFESIQSCATKSLTEHELMNT